MYLCEYSKRSQPLDVLMHRSRVNLFYYYLFTQRYRYDGECTIMRNQMHKVPLKFGVSYASG